MVRDPYVYLKSVTHNIICNYNCVPKAKGKGEKIVDASDMFQVVRVERF